MHHSRIRRGTLDSHEEEPYVEAAPGKNGCFGTVRLPYIHRVYTKNAGQSKRTAREREGGERLVINSSKSRNMPPESNKKGEGVISTKAKSRAESEGNMSERLEDLESPPRKALNATESIIPAASTDADLLNYQDNAASMSLIDSVSTLSTEPGLSMERFDSYYKDSNEEIGEGGFGRVQLFKLKRDLTASNNPTNIIVNEGEEVAVKTIFKNKSKMFEQNCRREFNIARMLKHKNILTVYELYEDDEVFKIVMEYIKGGTLLDRIAGTKCYMEYDARNIICQIIEAMVFLHGKNIIHCDLKPANILVRIKVPGGNSGITSDRVLNPTTNLYVTIPKDAQGEEITLFDARNRYEVVICDFGISKLVTEEEMRRSESVKLGAITRAFIPPAELARGYGGSSMDVYALGVITYMLLSGGRHPFGLTAKETSYGFQAKIKGPVIFDDDIWSDISELGKNFIRRLLNKNSKERPTFKQLTEHPWFEPATLSRKEGKIIRAADSYCKSLAVREHDDNQLNARSQINRGITAASLAQEEHNQVKIAMQGNRAHANDVEELEDVLSDHELYSYGYGSVITENDDSL